MEDNRPNQDLTNQDIEFIKEKVKERPLNRRKTIQKNIADGEHGSNFRADCLRDLPCAGTGIFQSAVPGGGAAAGGAEGRKYRG